MSAANVVPMLAGIGLLSACCISSSVVASVMGGGETPEESTPTQPTEYVYDFIVKEQSPRTNDFNIHITDIEADGVRVTPEQLTIHEEPEHAKCNSKANGYECEGDNYGMNDPEPVDGEYKDLSWSAWKQGQGEVGTKVPLGVSILTDTVRADACFVACGSPLAICAGRPALIPVRKRGRSRNADSSTAQLHVK